MKKLMKKASNEVLTNTEFSETLISGVSENLHDISMYLEENKGNLPIKSEVSIDELFQLVNKSIQDLDAVKDKLSSSEQWLYAIREA